MDTGILIVGGGPAGLVAAIAARRKGFQVTVADPASPPHDKACGEGLMPVALAVCKRLGIEFPEDAGVPFQGIRFIGPKDRIEANFPEGAGRAIRRTALHALLADRAARSGVELLWGQKASECPGDSVVVGGRPIRARWIIGADGGQSNLRRWMGLDKASTATRRFGFRQHYAIEPWASHVEIYWGDGCQLYVTPVSSQEVGVALISRDPHLRLRDALPRFPELAKRLRSAEAASRERGGCSVTRRLKRVTSGRVALVGDASGSVDAITGDGIALAFQQAEVLVEALAGEDLDLYEAGHRRISRRPAYMGELLLTLDRNRRLRDRVFRALASQPALFTDLLALHAGTSGAADAARIGLALGWRLAAA